MKQSIGKRIWAIAEGYIPGWSNGPAPEFTSHEAFCILNATDDEAHIELTIFYADREPVGPYKITVAARRTHHFRFNHLTDAEPARHELRERVRVGHSDRRPAHAARLAAGRERAAEHDRFSWG